MSTKIKCFFYWLTTCYELAILLQRYNLNETLFNKQFISILVCCEFILCVSFNFNNVWYSSGRDTSKQKIHSPKPSVSLYMCFREVKDVILSTTGSFTCGNYYKVFFVCNLWWRWCLELLNLAGLQLFIVCTSHCWSWRTPSYLMAHR